MTKLVGEIKPYVWQSFEEVEMPDCFPRFSPDEGYRKLLFDDDFCDGLFDKKFNDDLYLNQDSSFASTNQLRQPLTGSHKLLSEQEAFNCLDFLIV